MAMTSEVQMQLSKHNIASIGGNLAVTGDSGSGAATAVLRHHASSVASIEFMATAGLRSIIGVQATR
jgi:DnaJ homolog subfamily C member 11